MEVKLIWGGWNTKGSSDKVWGVIQRCEPKTSTKASDTVYVFWGARGKSMLFKTDKWGYDLQNLIHTKARKGYQQIDYDKLLKIWPDFEDKLSMRLTWHVLTA